MGIGATECEVLEKKLEKKLKDPETEPLVSLPLYFLKDITSGFSSERELGRGACGIVYKGVLRSGKTIAVKKIFDTYLKDNDNRVKNEIICLTEVRHQNVVQLVGYCVEAKSEVMEYSGKHVIADKNECLLCFEFLYNGSLDRHLSDGTLELDWDKRYKIIRGVCRGLHYLHSKCRIVHRDLKPQNILMDDMMMPKIGDFDLSRLLDQEKSRIVTANYAGTLGYMAPECIEQKFISFATDIFSLGVIIIEIITGHRDYPSMSERTEMSFKHYTDKVVGSWRNRTPMHMSPEMHIQQVEKCISIALMCLEPESKKRPTSLDIVQDLDALKPESGSPGNSPSDPEEDMRNQSLHGQVNVNMFNIQKTISVVNGLNECANLFQWVTTAISSLKSQSNETQQERLQRDICQLHSDLQCLTDTLPAIDNLIDRAEWRIHHDSVADLLSRLKDAVYDAEDLLDEFRWYETKLSIEGNGISVEPFIKFFQGSFNKLTGMQKRLNNLSKQLEKQGLLPAIPKFEKSSRPETSFFSTEAKMIGRDEEKKELIMLLGVPTNNSSCPSGCKRKRRVISSTSNQVCATMDNNEPTIVSVRVLPIVGIGGVGKTTLAQDICNHSKVKGHFDLIIWICVSDDFDVKRLTKEAIEQTSGKVVENGNLNSLQLALANRVNNKRFLVVLDDMWDENEQHWKHFCAPFKHALQGSMMLVTTRSLKVADVVRTMDPFPLEGLKEDVFQKFFKFCVFGPNISNIDPELEQIGEKILPKLRGSPLAAKTLGRLLGMSLQLAHWDRILKSQLWELQQKETDILPALRLSYIYLPLYLKRCFSFCAVYPKDYIFEKENLVEIWVAEGLVKHHPNISLHHTGGQYFEELAHLSFFQKYPRNHKKYVIHDLIHDMAQLVSKEECFIVKEKNDLLKIPQNVRHLSVLKGGDIRCSDLLKHDMAQHRKLRTLFCHQSLNSEIGNTVMEKWCNELLCMRVMVCSISKWGLPASISYMKLLRYLQILNSSVCKSLPSALCCLYNMQIFYAKKWQIYDIPPGFDMLINMQKFESVECQFPPKLSVSAFNDESLPRWHLYIRFYNAESLPRCFHPQNSEQIVTDVQIADCRNLLSLERFLQPGYLSIIKNIEISNCRSLESVPTERFRDFRFLEVLSVSHCPNIKSRHLFAPSLKKLYLEDSGNLGYKIECSSLTILHLSNSPLESIELMCNLQLLQELEIDFCPSLTVIRDSEPISSDIFHAEGRNRAIDHTFLSLTDVENCSNLSSQEQFLQPVNMPIIMKIRISNCRSLESVPSDRFGYFRFLELLNVFCCPRIKSRHLFAPSLKVLRLAASGNLGYKIECSSLTTLVLSYYRHESIELQLWNLPLLQELEITSSPSLTVIRDSEPISSDILLGEATGRTIGNTFSSLTDVVIRDCQNLSSLEQFLQPGHVPMVKKITIADCGSLEAVPAERFGDLCFLEVLSVYNCPNIKSQHVFAPSLKRLFLSNSGNLGYNIECSSLTILHLTHYPLESIELQMWNLPLLKDHSITLCSSLTVIRDYEPIDGLLYLPAVESIKISDCGLLSLPANRLGSFPQLKDLDISGCPSFYWQSGTLLSPSVKKLRLLSCGDISAWFPSCLENLTSLEELQICYCEFIVSVPGHLWSSNLKSLQRLKFRGCSELQSIGGPGAIVHIKDLYIRDCPKLKEIVQPMTRGSHYFV